MNTEKPDMHHIFADAAESASLQDSRIACAAAEAIRRERFVVERHLSMGGRAALFALEESVLGTRKGLL